MTLLTYEEYAAVISVTCGISFFLGFFLARRIKSRIAVFILLFLVIIADGFLIYNYLTSYYQKHEGVCYLVFVLASLLQVSNGCAVVYYTKRANKIILTPEEQEMLGSMIFEVILAGGCTATILSAFLPTIKSLLHHHGAVKF